MKKIFLLSFLVTPFLLGGCNNKKIDGPVNKYFEKYSFRKSGGESDYITDSNRSHYLSNLNEVSHIDEVEEEYRYVDGVEELTTKKSNTEFFTTTAEKRNYHPYISETNISYAYTKSQENTKSEETYTSNIVKWDGAYDDIFTVETIKRDDKVEKKYDVKPQNTEDAFNELFIDPVGKAYYDRKNNLCFYTEVTETITKEDFDQQPYSYTHREQAIYVYEYLTWIKRYHYYDEVVSNRDPETGKFFDNERIISYHYHEIDFTYGRKELKNTSDLDKLLDGQSLILKVDFVQHLNRYRIENGNYKIDKGDTYHEPLEYQVTYDSDGNPTYTAYVMCLDSPLYYASTMADGLANRLEVSYQIVAASNALATGRYNLGYSKYLELFNRYGIDVIQDIKGDYFIFTKSFNTPPLLVVSLKIEKNNGNKTTIDVNIIEQKDG